MVHTSRAVHFLPSAVQPGPDPARRPPGWETLCPVFLVQQIQSGGQMVDQQKKWITRALISLASSTGYFQHVALRQGNPEP